MKRVLITGAGGFVGQATVRWFLDHGYEVRGLLLPEAQHPFCAEHLQWVRGDIRQLASLQSAVAGCDVVVHLAAAKGEGAESERINVEGSRNVVLACEVAGVRRVIYVSTISAKLQNPGVYGETKARAEIIFRERPIETIILRPSLVYGPGDRGVFAILVRLAGRSLVPVIGKGDSTYDPIFVDDMAEILGRVASWDMAKERCVVFEVGAGKNRTLNAILTLIGTHVHGRSRIRLFHIPIWFAAMSAQLLRVLPHPPLTLGQVRASTQTVPVYTTPLLDAIAFTPRPLKEGLQDLRVAQASGPRRLRTVAEYLLGPAQKRADLSLLMRMDQALKQFGLERAIPEALLSERFLLAGADAMTKLLRPKGDLQTALFVCTAVVECSPASASWLLPKQRTVVTLLGIWVRASLASLVALCIGGYVWFHYPSVRQTTFYERADV